MTNPQSMPDQIYPDPDNDNQCSCSKVWALSAEIERLRAALSELVYKDGDHWFTTMADGADVTHLMQPEGTK